MTRKLNIFLTLFFAAAFMLFHFAEGMAGEPMVSQEDLLSSIMRKDASQVVSILNEIKQQPQQEHVLPLIADLWAKRKESHPELPWDFVTKDSIRIELADILIQAHANGIVIHDFGDIHEYARKMMNNSDPDISRKAILSLGLLDDKIDAVEIAEIARKEDGRSFRPAVLALSTMCNSYAESALKELVKKTSGENHEFVAATISKSLTMKANSRWCSAPK